MEYTWNDSLNLGMPTIDDEHHEIFSLLTALSKEMKKCSRSRNKVNKLLDTLETYSRQHFELEDAYIVKNQQLSKYNRLSYAEFLRKVSRVRDFYNEGNYNQSRLIHEDMCEWMYTHIRHVDKQLMANILKV